MTETLWKVQTYPNPDFRDYHTKVALTDRRLEADWTTPGLGELGQIFLKLSGVTEVTLSRYTLTVKKGRGFDWEEVEPGILAVLAHLAEPVEEESV